MRTSIGQPLHPIGLKCKRTTFSGRRAGSDAMGRFAPQTAGLRDVGPVDGGDTMARPAAGGVEGPAHDALDLILIVVHEVVAEGAPRAVHARVLDVLGALVGAEVDAARKLAHNEDIHSLELLGTVVECTPLPQRTVRPNLGNARVQPNPLGGGRVDLRGNPVDVLGEKVETSPLLIKVGLHEMLLVRTAIAQGVNNGDVLFEISPTCTRIVWHAAIAFVTDGLPDSRLKPFDKKVTPNIE